MATFSQTSLVVAAILGAAAITGLMLAQAQETSASATPTAQATSTPPISLEFTAQLNAVEQLPTIPADAVPLVGGTFWSAQFPYWPPFPANFDGVPVWGLGDGWFLLDDLQLS